MNKFTIDTGINLDGKKHCVFCKRPFSFPEITWDGENIEFNNMTLWIDSFCSQKCARSSIATSVAEEIKFNVESTLYRNGVPKMYLHCSFDNFKIETQNHVRATEHLKAVTLPFKKSVLLFGNCGTGKTHLAIATMRKIIVDKKITSPMFISAPKLIGEIRRATLGEIEQNEEDIIEKYTTGRLLIIDDIGVEKHSEFVAQCWYRIIDARTSNNLPTIYTSNLTKAEIETKMGPRIASRLFACTIIPIDGTDKR